jgi:uncharacterized protein (TIGR00255 family)
MKSMTGYGYRETAADGLAVAVELKSYNNRFLEIYVNLPSFLSPLEPRLRDYVAGRCERGKVELSVRLKETAAALAVRVDAAAARAYFDALSGLAADLGLDEKPKLSQLIGLEGVLTADRSRDLERYWAALEPALADACAQFEAARRKEGEVTQADILSHIAVLEAAAAEVAGYVPGLEAGLKDTLRLRFAEVLGDRVDENRVLAETAVLLVKYSISEELTRLNAHLAAFRAETAANPAPGKKLDFLCQELNREINTIGSKSPMLEVGRAVIAMKDGLENIREQLRNVE